MIEECNKNIESILQDIDSCNTYFSNHVGIHDEEMIRRGILIVLNVVAVVIIVLV